MRACIERERQSRFSTLLESHRLPRTVQSETLHPTPQGELILRGRGHSDKSHRVRRVKTVRCYDLIWVVSECCLLNSGYESMDRLAERWHWMTDGGIDEDASYQNYIIAGRRVTSVRRVLEVFIMQTLDRLKEWESHLGSWIDVVHGVILGEIVKDMSKMTYTRVDEETFEVGIRIGGGIAREVRRVLDEGEDGITLVSIVERCDVMVRGDVSGEIRASSWVGGGNHMCLGVRILILEIGLVDVIKLSVGGLRQRIVTQYENFGGEVD
ncbi:hypothetical protein Tco_0084734 [Tanacetum coccineum]